MTKVHRDGRALLKLSRQVRRDDVKNPSRENVPNPKPAPKESIQRQDTDYDVRPEIPTPNPAPKKGRPEKAGQQAQANVPDDGNSVHATQMGESEDMNNHDPERAQSRMLRSICV